MRAESSSGLRGTTSEPASFTDLVPPGWHSLFTPQGVERLAQVEAAFDDGKNVFAVGATLRAQGVEGDEVAALLSQAELRKKAKSKFGPAATRMLFTPAGLEQASRMAVAQMHALRFAEANCRRVADLGCGIGTESIALLEADIGVLAIDIDPFTAQIARHNLTSVASTTAQGTVRTCSAQEAPLDDIDGAFLDPARRTAGQRNTRRLAHPDDYSPSLSFAFGLAERMPTGVKLGPGFERELIPDSAEAQWVSVDGQVVETGLWFGPLARDGVKRAALVLRSGVSHELTAEADWPDVDEQPLGDYLYEPDGAVIRARLIGLLAESLRAGMISESIAYLTSDTLTPTPFAQAFRITDQLPASEKQLKRALAQRDIGSLEIKKRGSDVDPATLRKRLQLKGKRHATLVLTRVAGKHTALLAERV